MTQHSNDVNQAFQDWTQALYETNKAIAQSAIAAQERNVKFAQRVYEGGIAVLKSHTEATQNLSQTQPQNQQEAMQAIVGSTLAAQERNMHFAQDVFGNGTEVLKEHVDAMQSLLQSLVQSLAEQVKEQQAAFSTQSYAEAYVNMLSTPFAYYKQAIETAQSLTQQAMSVAQKSAQQAMEISQKVTQQAMEAAAAAQ